MVMHGTTRRRFVQAVAGGGLALSATGVASASSHQPQHWLAVLAGEYQDPPVQTPAHGLAVFARSRDGDALRYTLLVANITDVTMAHIHLGTAGEDGPIVAWLYPAEGQSPRLIEGQFSGVLAEATVTADDLVGPLEGEPMEELIAAMNAGTAYVNVHTEAHPGGAIRGQIL